MNSPRPEYVVLPTHQALQAIRPNLIRLSAAPPLDVLVDLAIDIVNQEVASRNPAEVIVKQRIELLDFEVNEDYPIFTTLLCTLVHQLKDLFLTFNLYGPNGVDYRFWRTVNDDCILQHIQSKERPPASVYRGTHFPHY